MTLQYIQWDLKGTEKPCLSTRLFQLSEFLGILDNGKISKCLLVRTFKGHRKFFSHTENPTYPGSHLKMKNQNGKKIYQ